MPKTHPLMKLSPDEESFLRQWMYDEVHYEDGQGPAKRLQVQHRATAADLAALIAAAIPNLADQKAAGYGPPPATAPTWPWQDEDLRARVAEARVVLESVRPKALSGRGGLQAS